MPTSNLKHQGAERLQFAPRGKVLLVDEDVKDLDYYCAILQERGYQVCIFASHAKALSNLERESFDIVVVSQGGRGFEGHCVLECAMRIDRRTPVLVITRCRDMHCYLEAMQLGAVDYLEKPIAPLELAQVMETYKRPHGGKA